MKNSKNKRATILTIILLGLIVVGYKVMFISSGEDLLLLDENTAASKRVEDILREVESINFDTSTINDQKFKSLKSIETPLISLPIGKTNPFSAIPGSN